MPLQPSKFKLDEEISLYGKPMLVAGRLQMESPDAKLTTRYTLADASGASQLLEEEPENKFTLLRPFPPAAQPLAAGNTVSVMGEKYTLGAVRRLKVTGSEGRVSGGAGSMLLSGLFQGGVGSLVREMVPGAPAQSFYSAKPVHPNEVLGAAERAAQAEAERAAANARAEAEDEAEEGEKSSPIAKAVTWIVVVLVIIGLVYACSGDDEGSSGSARTSFSSGSSGGK
jgi:hypothetical protein